MIAKSIVAAALFFVSGSSGIVQTPQVNSKILSLNSAAVFSSAPGSSARVAGNSGNSAQTKSTPTSSSTTPAAPVYEVFAIRYASIPDFPVNALIAGADPQRKLSIAMTVWLLRGNGRNILV